MTVVRPNSIAGINSITVQSGQALNIHDASGNLIRNITSSTGISTFASINVTQGSGDLVVGISTLFVDNSAGRIGIGTATPGNLLTVNGRTETQSITGHAGTNTDLQIASGHASSNVIFHIGQFGSTAVEKLRIDTSGRVLIGSGSTSDTKAGDSVLQVFASDRKHPAIRAQSSNANGYTLFGDAYKADESQANIGVTYSSASLVLSSCVKVSTSADDAYISSQDTFACRPSALKIGTDGTFKFLNTSNSATTTTDSAVSLTERLRIHNSGQLTLGSTHTEGHADADELTLSGTRTGITIRSSDDDYGNIFFSDATSGTGEYVGAVQYYHADNTLRLKTSSADKLIINSAGDVNISGVTTATTFVPTVGQLSNKNLIINGAMTIAQRGTSESSTGYETCDRWHLGGAWQGSALTQAQVDVSYTSVPYDKGFRKAFKITNSNQGSVAAGDNVEITYTWEGQDIAGSGWNYVATSGDDSKITLSFWIKSSVAQTFYGYLLTNVGTDMKYSFPIVCSTTDWEYKTVTIGGEGNFASNVNNSFQMSNTQALLLRFVPFYGTNYTDSGAVNNAWQNYSSSTITPDFATTWMLTNASTMEITGVQLEVGPVATPFEHLSHAENMRRCQRYYQRLPQSGDHIMWGFGRAESNSARVQIPLGVPLRAAPTITCSNNRSCKYDGTMVQSTSTPTVFQWKEFGSMIILDFPSGGTLTHNNVYIVTSDGGNGLRMDSEL